MQHFVGFKFIPLRLRDTGIVHMHLHCSDPLSAPRHRSMRAALDSSWQRLSPAEQSALQALSV